MNDPHPPGHDWIEIIQRPTQAGFAAAFTQDVALDTSVASGPILGAVAIRHFFDATRAMYDTIAFVHETTSPSRTCLEWEGRFEGRPVAGATILTRDKDGTIESIRLYHRPYDQVLAFSAELARRMEDKGNRSADHGN